MKITIKEIADFAGVGKSTVSRYFNGGYVKQSTRVKIEEVCRTYNYQPNAVAKSLKAKHSYQIGVITPSLESFTSGIVLTALDEQLRMSGYTPILINTNHNELRELSSLESFTRMNVEGIILLATHITKKHEEIIKNLNVPIVVLAQETSFCNTIVLDDYQAGYDIGKMIGKKNHKKITVVSVSDNDIAVGINRKQGIIDGLNMYKDININVIETTFLFENAKDTIKNYLSDINKSDIDCMICVTDTIAHVALKELHNAGYKVPHDLSVVGFGGHKVSQTMIPSLVSVRFDYKKEGELAADNILKLINDEQVPSSKIGYEIIEGESVR